MSDTNTPKKAAGFDEEDTPKTVSHRSADTTSARTTAVTEPRGVSPHQVAPAVDQQDGQAQAAAGDKASGDAIVHAVVEWWLRFWRAVYSVFLYYRRRLLRGRRHGRRNHSKASVE